MCCDSSPSVPATPVADNSTAPIPVESEFSKTMAQIMRERQSAAKKFEPLEDQLISSVQQFQTPEFSQEQVNASKSDVTRAFAGTRAASAANAASMGLNPADPRSLAMERGTNIAEAGAVAGAGTSARQNARRLAFDSLAGVSGRGDAKVGQAISAAGTGGQLYNQAQGNQIGWNQGRDSFNQNNWQMQQRAQQAADQADSGAWGGIGSLIGTGAMLMMSSRRLKRDIKDVDTGEGSLRRVRAMPVKRWRYKDGVGDGGEGEHVGPMAEDAAAATGQGDGFTLNVGDMVGHTMGAVQELDRKVRRLEKRA
jgi:hypothetical protein